MGIATDLITQGQTLVTDRQQLERTWENICRMMFLSPDRQFRRGSIMNTVANFEQWTQTSKVAERARLIYDITGVTALERMTSGIISLVTPDNEKWELSKIDDPFGYEMSDSETKWAEKQRNYRFSCRYDPRSGWALCNQAAIASAAALGTGAYITEEAFGGPHGKIPFKCTNLPLSDNYFTVDGQGLHDQDYRFLSLPARVAAMMFKGLSDKTMKMANDPKQCHRIVQFLHYVGPRKESGPSKNAYAADEATPGNYNRRSEQVSIYVEIDAKLDVKHEGFDYWPIIVYSWKQMTNSAYSDSAAMLVMAEVQSANILAKNALLGAQQQTRPAIATMDDSSLNRPNLNPAAINYGMLDKQGNLKIKPVITAGNPQLSEIVLENSRKQIEKGLYAHFWDIMMQGDPKKTATQSLIEANVKGEIIGPVGTRIQIGLSRQTDAEMAILKSRGAFAEGSPLQPPETIFGKELKSKFNSPLDRLRRSGELIGIQQTLEVAGAIAQFDEEIMDELDGPEILKLTREISGAPASIRRGKEQVEELREGRAQQKQIAAAGAVAEVAKTGADAVAKVAPQQANIAALMSRIAGAGQAAPTEAAA